MNDDEAIRDSIREMLEAAFIHMKEQMAALERGDVSSLFDMDVSKLGPCPIGDPDAEELERILNLKSPK